MKKTLFVTVGIAVSAVLLWLALRGTDLASISAALRRADWYWAAPFLVVLFLFYWLKSQRWTYLLSTVAPLKSGQLFPSVMIGYAGSAVLPLQLGEVARAYVASERLRLPFGAVLSSLAVEKVFDLLTVLVFLAILLNTGVQIPGEISAAGYAIGLVAVAGFVTIGVILARPTWFEALVDRLFAWASATTRATLRKQVHTISRGMDAVRDPRTLTVILLSSVAQWVLMGICIYLSLEALAVAVPAYGVALVLIATVIGISLPASPGFVGNIQFAFVVALQPLGVSASDAIAASVFYHVIAYASVVVVGFSFLYAYGLNLRSLGSRKAPPEPAPD